MRDEFDGEETLVPERTRRRAEEVLSDFPEKMTERQLDRMARVAVDARPQVRLRHEDKEALLAGLQETVEASAELMSRVRAAAVDDARPGWRTRIVRTILWGAVRERLARVPTWFWEQAVLAALLAFALYWHSRAWTGWRDGAVAVVSALTVLVAQKVRSIADRQREANARAGVADERVRCADAQGFYGVQAQYLGLMAGLIAAPVWPHWLVAAYVFLYPVWRRWYRSRVKAREDVSVAELVGRLSAGARPPGADLLHRLADMQTVLVAWVSPSFDCEAELAARFARDLLREPAARALVLHTDAERRGRLVALAERLGCDVYRVYERALASPLHGLRYDRVFAVVELRVADGRDVPSWLRSEVLLHLTERGRAVVLWTATTAPNAELSDLGCFVDLREETRSVAA